MAKTRSKRKQEQHVRMYRHELQSLAWKTLCPDGRSLLIEMRSLYDGKENRVHMSVRQAMQRLNVGQRRAQSAINALLERGWIRVIERGAFSRKVRHATVYALENEPIHGGEIAPRSFMRWQPDQKNTVAEMTTDGSRSDYRGAPKTPKNTPDGSRSEHRKARNQESTVAKTATQISYHRG